MRTTHCNINTHKRKKKKKLASSRGTSFTLSPISETNINENAAVNPDFANASKSVEGPFAKAMSENTEAHPNSTRAIARG